MEYADMKKFIHGNPTMVKPSIKAIDLEKMEESPYKILKASQIWNRP